MTDFDRRQQEANFPADRRVTVSGILHQPGRSDREAQVSLGFLDREQKPATVWVDLPNAMYLLALLRQVQQATGAELPAQPPG